MDTGQPGFDSGVAGQQVDLSGVGFQPAGKRGFHLEPADGEVGVFAAPVDIEDFQCCRLEGVVKAAIAQQFGKDDGDTETGIDTICVEGIGDPGILTEKAFGGCIVGAEHLAEIG